MFYSLTPISRNAKIGPMPVSTISATTCPSSCPFSNGGGCYADSGGPLAIHWRKVTSGERGLSFSDFLRKVRQLPRGIWRYAQAGDLPGEGDQVDADQLLALAKANQGRPVLCYTHKPLTEKNTQALTSANDHGFHINISCETLEKCDEAIEQGFSAVVVIPSTYQRGKNETLEDYKTRIREADLKTPAGAKVAICPATYAETSCVRCGACAKSRAGNTVIAFPSHGTRKRTVDAILS